MNEFINNALMQLHSMLFSQCSCKVHCFFWYLTNNIVWYSTLIKLKSFQSLLKPYIIYNSLAVPCAPCYASSFIWMKLVISFNRVYWRAFECTIFFVFPSSVYTFFQRVSKLHRLVHVRSMDFPNLVDTLVAISLRLVDGHRKSESHRILQTFELELHICQNHWNAWQQYIFPFEFYI
jgi:hypothetical protein